MNQSTYNPCDAKAAFKAQGRLLLVLGSTILVALTIMAAVYGILLLLRRLHDHSPSFQTFAARLPELISAGALITLIALLSGAVGYMVFKPVIYLAVGRLKTRLGRNRPPSR